jgi:hypothetical protein
MNTDNTDILITEIQTLAKEMGFKNPIIIVYFEGGKLLTKLEIDGDNALDRFTYLTFDGALESSLKNMRTSLKEFLRMMLIGG